jgi:hypothetical protein
MAVLPIFLGYREHVGTAGIATGGIHGRVVKFMHASRIVRNGWRHRLRPSTVFS